MDSGEEIPALNEGWSFLGAKLFEWMAGFLLAMLSSTVVTSGTISSSMPMYLAIVFGTALGVASVRKKFPDEERGMRNSFMVMCGITPPGVPSPSTLQPYWSSYPNKQFKPECEFIQLGLDKLFKGTGTSIDQSGESVDWAKGE
jgi:hypothetical protein